MTIRARPLPERIREEALEVMMRGFGTPDEDLDLRGRVERTSRLVARALLAAERRGAEEMRERAAARCDKEANAWDLPEPTVGTSTMKNVCDKVASSIRALPLPGENDTHAALGLERTPTEREEGREGKP